LKKEIKKHLEEQNNQQHVHEQKKTEKSKRLRTTVPCQPATAARGGENRGRDEEREKQPLRMQTLNNRTFEMKTLTAAHAVTNRCWAVVWFLLKNRRFRVFAKMLF
jgi:hypothetical protein